MQWHNRRIVIFCEKGDFTEKASAVLLMTFTPADWVCLFEARFSFSVESLRQRFPQGTGSLLSLLARVLSRVFASPGQPPPPFFANPGGLDHPSRQLFFLSVLLPRLVPDELPRPHATVRQSPPLLRKDALARQHPPRPHLE